MAQIIWDGNKNWENVWDGKQPWDREIEEKIIPENAVLIDRPDDIIKASIPYMIIPCIVCFVAIFTKKAQSDEFIFNLWFMPLSFIIGFFVAMPLHEFLHAISYPKGAKVYIGVSLKQLRAYAASSAALSRGRYIMMSLAPLIPGIIFLAVFVVCPISMKWLMTICVVPSFMGLISPAPGLYGCFNHIAKGTEGGNDPGNRKWIGLVSLIRQIPVCRTHENLKFRKDF